MTHDYMFVSPSVHGVLSHEVLAYEGVRRPLGILHVADRPRAERSADELRLLEQYFQDIYGVFIKKLSCFAIESRTEVGEELKLQALLQEMIKVKKLLN